MGDFQVLHGFRDHAGRQIVGGSTLIGQGSGLLLGMEAFIVRYPGKPTWHTEIGRFDLMSFCVPIPPVPRIATIYSIDEKATPAGRACACGCDSVGSSKHSNYCPKYVGSPEA